MEILRGVSVSKLWPVKEIPNENTEICLVKAVIKSVIQGTNPQGETYYKFSGSFRYINLLTQEVVNATSSYFPSIATEQLFEMYQGNDGVERVEKKRYDPKTGLVASISHEYSGTTIEVAFKLLVKPDAKDAKPTIKGYSWGADFLTSNNHNPFASLDQLLTEK